MIECMSTGLDEAAYNRRLGRALADLRDAAQMTREAAAEHIGVNPQTIGRWERGEVTISAWGTASLAEVYGLEPSAWHDLFDPPERVNPWRERLDPARTDALGWEQRTRTESPDSPADQAPARRRRGR